VDLRVFEGRDVSFLDNDGEALEVLVGPFMWCRCLSLLKGPIRRSDFGGITGPASELFYHAY
jgi:hypothetical protein